MPPHTRSSSRLASRQPVPISSLYPMPVVQIPPRRIKVDGVSNTVPTSRSSSIRQHAEPEPEDEVQRLRRELQDMRKRREVVELRAEIEQEQRLLAQAEQRLGTIEKRDNHDNGEIFVEIDEDVHDHIAVHVKQEEDNISLEDEDDGSSDGYRATSREPRGQKRPRSCSEVSNEFDFSNCPGRLYIEEQCPQKGFDRFMTFISQMEDHFQKHAHWYRYNSRKIEEAKSRLAPRAQHAWQLHCEQTGWRNAGWEDFVAFFRRLAIINSRDAIKRYANARQTRSQSVEQFEKYLHRFELVCPNSSLFHRKENLRVRLMKEIQAESLKHDDEPAGYDDFVKYLIRIEQLVRSRG